MPEKLTRFLSKETTNLEHAGLLKAELRIDSPQRPTVLAGNREVVNLASANYLGLANSPNVKKAAKAAVERFGVGLSASPMLTGTQPIHVELEQAICSLLQTDETLLYASGYEASIGLFESLLRDGDSVFVDGLCHPAVADGLRLCDARIYSYDHDDLTELEDRLKRSRAARFRVVVTDGVSELDGLPARLEKICELAKKYDALTVVEDSQGIGVLGPGGRGTAEHVGVLGQIDVTLGTFSGALGGAAGGFTSGRKEVISWLRQKSRPYQVSGAIPPASVGAGLAAIESIHSEPDLRVKLQGNVQLFRENLTKAGFTVNSSQHPIVSTVVGNAVNAQKMADALFELGTLVVGFCHPVVAQGEARIRAQLSAKHSRATVMRVSDQFAQVGRELGILQ